MTKLVFLCLFITGCASYQQSSIDSQAMVGQDVDKVIFSLESKGYVCSEKRSINIKAWSEVVGVVQCGMKEVSLACPTSYGIRLTFNLKKNIVYTAVKTEKDNCF